MLTPSHQLGVAPWSFIGKDFEGQSGSLGESTIIHYTCLPWAQNARYTFCGFVILDPILHTGKLSPREGKLLVQGLLTKVELEPIVSPLPCKVCFCFVLF